MTMTAYGRITGTAGTRFTANFVLPDTGLDVKFVGNFSSSVQKFSSASATLRYDNMGHLTAARQFDGQLGEKSVKLNMANGPVIEGVLDTPLSTTGEVSGSGVWTIS